MGLDGVELVIEFEREFAISIPDEDVDRLTTVGLTAQYIAAALASQQGPPEACPSARIFYSLRRQLIEQAGIPRSAITPKAKLGPLLPSRRHDWNRIADASGLRRDNRGFFQGRLPPADISVRHLIETRGNIFLRQFRPTTEADIFPLVRQIVAEQMAISVDRISPDTPYSDLF